MDPDYKSKQPFGNLSTLKNLHYWLNLSCNNLLHCKFMLKMTLIIIPNAQKTNVAGTIFKKITEIVNKPGVDVVKYVVLYSKKRVGPTK